MTGFRETRSNPSPVDEFEHSQARLLARFGVQAESRLVDTPVTQGRAHLLVAGAGPPLMMVIGGTIPAAFWAPLMPHLRGYTLYAVDLPGFGLTDAVDYQTQPLRPLVVEFLAQVLDGVGLQRAPFVTNSQGSLWSTWLSLDRPNSVAAQVMVGCPAHILGTSAPLPMRAMSIPLLGRALLKLQAPSPRQVNRVFTMVHEDASAPPEIRELLLACERLPDYAGSLVGLMGAVMRLGRVRPEIALTGEQLGQVVHPVQLIWGEDDPFGSPAVARRAAAHLRDGELHLLPGGHAPWFRHADRVGELAARFLRDHRATGQ